MKIALNLIVSGSLLLAAGLGLGQSDNDYDYGRRFTGSSASGTATFSSGGFSFEVSNCSFEFGKFAYDKHWDPRYFWFAAMFNLHSPDGEFVAIPISPTGPGEEFVPLPPTGTLKDGFEWESPKWLNHLFVTSMSYNDGVLTVKSREQTVGLRFDITEKVATIAIDRDFTNVESIEYKVTSRKAFRFDELDNVTPEVIETVTCQGPFESEDIIYPGSMYRYE